MNLSNKIPVLVLFFGFGVITSLRIIPECTNVTYVNQKYMHWAYTELKCYGYGGVRCRKYYINVAGHHKHNWANNVTFRVTFAEFVRNAYRSSFIDLHFKFCDLVHSDPYIGKMLVKAGITCPSPAGEYHLWNLTVPSERFPNVWPFQRGRVDIEAALTDTGESIVRGFFTASFKAEKKT